MLASVATAALALGGLVATAMPASAHTPNVSADCQNLTVDLWAYADGSQRSWWHGKKRGGQHGSDGKVNTVTITVNGEVEVDETFGKSSRQTVPLDPTRSNEWTVEVDAWDNDAYDFNESGTTEPCVTPEPDRGGKKHHKKVQTAFYVYPKLDSNEPAAWHNSGKQTLITTRDGGEFWETLPEEYPGEYGFDVESLPEDVCESWGVQQDIVGIHKGFDWADYVHITYPHGPLFKKLYADRHSDLSEFLPECGDAPKEQVTLPAPSSVEECEAENSVELPESEHATYTEEWNDDRTEVTVTATPHEGVELTEGSETSWTFTFTGDVCQPEPEVVTPGLPTVEDLCGTENDDVRLPANTAEVTYETTADGIVATPAEGFAFDDEALPAEYTAQGDGTALYTLPEGSFTDEPCELVPGDTGAVCDAETPYLVYEVSLPEGSENPGENPLTVTFLNPDGEDHVTTDLPLEGRLLWPGASAEEPLQWPGWEQLEDGSYVETDDNYAWTRDGVQVQFEVNPDYSTVVNYPPASEDCADAPENLREAPAQTVVDVPVDAEEVAAQEDELAVTGATIGVAAAVALLLVGGGVALFVVRRRLQQS